MRADGAAKTTFGCVPMVAQENSGGLRSLHYEVVVNLLLLWGKNIDFFRKRLSSEYPKGALDAARVRQSMGRI